MENLILFVFFFSFASDVSVFVLAAHVSFVAAGFVIEIVSACVSSLCSNPRHLCKIRNVAL